ncbi:uncharacterized protein [Nicotiana sylvestris]|uniref:uncharacterized protein n=1 Tax=Nicotiana sylvestris TaxID=4096 RepID=UPI00388CBE03
MREEMYKLKQQMVEMYQAWANGHPPPAYPANPAYIPPLAQPQEHPTVNSSPAFPLYQQCHGTSSHTSQASPPKQVTYPPPPVTHVFVAPPPATLHRSSSEPMFQTHDNQYYPPEPTFKVLEPYSYTPNLDLAAETEKPPKNPEQEEMIRKALEPTYFGHLVSAVGKSFNEIVKMEGFRPNQAFKNERLQKQKTFTPLGKSYTSLFYRLRQLGMLNPIEAKLLNPLPRNLDRSLSCEYCSGAPGHDTEKFWKLKTVVQELIDTHRTKVQAPEAPNINQNPLAIHHETHMIELIHKEGEPKKPSQTVMMICSSETSPKEKIISGKLAVQSKGVDNKPAVIAEKESSSTIVVKPEKAKVVVPGVASKPVVVVKGARTEPVIIKPVTHLPGINNKAVPWNYERVTVTYQGKEVREEVCETHGLTRSGRCFAPEELRKDKTSKDSPVLVKKAVSEEEAEEFLKKMKVQDYSIVERLRKTPTQISLLSLLIHSDEHHWALIKIFNEAHVPNEISVNHLEKIANKIFEVLDVAVSYNMLLGRPWIHAVKVVPSTLNQVVKFEWDRQEIIVHGFKPTVADVRQARKMKKKARALPKPIPHLSRSFVRPSIKKQLLSKVLGSLIGADGDLDKGLARLFAEVNMVEPGEGLSKANVQFMGPRAKVNNWKATPLPIRRESL